MEFRTYNEGNDSHEKKQRSYQNLTNNHQFRFYVAHRSGGGHIVFSADPVGVGFSVSVTLSCLHDIS